MQRKYPMECNQMTKEEREGEKKKKKKKTRPQMKCEAKYTMPCAPRGKTLARGGFFFTGPSRSVARVGGVHCVCVCVCVRVCVCGGGLGYKSSPTGLTVQTTAAWQGGCTLYRIQQLKNMHLARHFLSLLSSRVRRRWNEPLSWKRLHVFDII